MTGWMKGFVLLAVITGACMAEALDLAGLPCQQGECMDGYVCNPLTDRCVTEVELHGDAVVGEAVCVATSASDATCNGVDDDCSGDADEGYVIDSTCGVGYCNTTNTPSSCPAAGPAVACSPGAALHTVELYCDGVDDDCDSATDEDCCVASSDFCDADGVTLLTCNGSANGIAGSASCPLACAASACVTVSNVADVTALMCTASAAALAPDTSGSPAATTITVTSTSVTCAITAGAVATPCDANGLADTNIPYLAAGPPAVLCVSSLDLRSSTIIFDATAPAGLVILVAGDASVDASSTINFDGETATNDSATAGGPGGGAGATGSDAAVNGDGADGSGTGFGGGGVGGATGEGDGGGGGSFGGSGGEGGSNDGGGGTGDGGSISSTYGDPTLIPLDAGSGGGGGGRDVGAGASGGGGGGALQLSVRGTLTLAGTITANGGAGAGTADWTGGGGGGSGGAVLLEAPTITITGSIAVDGGNGGSVTAGGGAGGAGATAGSTTGGEGVDDSNRGSGGGGGGAGRVRINSVGGSPACASITSPTGACSNGPW